MSTLAPRVQNLAKILTYILINVKFDVFEYTMGAVFHAIFGPYELHKPPKFIFWSKLQFLCRKMKFGRKKHTIHHAKFGVDSERVKLKN